MSLNFPVQPDRNSQDVISIISNNYTNLSGTDFNPNWGQRGHTRPDRAVQVDSVLTYTDFNYQGTNLDGSVDVEDMEFLHIDIFSETGLASGDSNTGDNMLYIAVITSAGEELYTYVTIIPNVVSTFNIPMDGFNVVGKSIGDPPNNYNIHQLKIGNGAELRGNLSVANIYFYKGQSLANNYTFTLHQSPSDVTWSVTSINISINDGPNVLHSVNTLGATNISISSSDFVSGTNTLKISNHSTVPGSANYGQDTWDVYEISLKDSNNSNISIQNVAGLPQAGWELPISNITDGNLNTLWFSFGHDDSLDLDGDPNPEVSGLQWFTFEFTRPAAPICFPKGTPVTTDQGSVAIEKLNPDKHTIRGKEIVAITQTRPLQKHIVCFEKDALSKNVPSQQTLCSKNHKIFYKGEMIKARNIVDMCENVTFVDYNGETLYNVLLKKHDKMMVNNLICETLHPKNIMAKISTMKDGQKKNKAIQDLTKIIKENNISEYQKMYASLK